MGPDERRHREAHSKARAGPAVNRTCRVVLLFGPCSAPCSAHSRGEYSTPGGSSFHVPQSSMHVASATRTSHTNKHSTVPLHSVGPVEQKRAKGHGSIPEGLVIIAPFKHLKVGRAAERRATSRLKPIAAFTSVRLHRWEPCAACARRVVARRHGAQYGLCARHLIKESVSKQDRVLRAPEAGSISWKGPIAAVCQIPPESAEGTLPL
jgi:hypothetical protein